MFKSYDGSLMKKISKQGTRQKAISNIMATLRIEQLTPSAEVAQGIRNCVAGKTTSDKLLADVISHHVTLRRV